MFLSNVMSIIIPPHPGGWVGGRRVGWVGGDDCPQCQENTKKMETIEMNYLHICSELGDSSDAKL